MRCASTKLPGGSRACVTMALLASCIAALALTSCGKEQRRIFTPPPALVLEEMTYEPNPHFGHLRRLWLEYRAGDSLAICAVFDTLGPNVGAAVIPTDCWLYAYADHDDYDWLGFVTLTATQCQVTSGTGGDYREPCYRRGNRIDFVAPADWFPENLTQLRISARAWPTEENREGALGQWRVAEYPGSAQIEPAVP